MTAVQNRLIGDLERTKKHLESLRVRKQMADVLNHLRMSDRPEVVAVRKAIEDKDRKRTRERTTSVWPLSPGESTHSAARNCWRG